MPLLKLHDDPLGPADGAIFRSMFPTPTPGEKAPYASEDVTLEELDAEWENAVRQAEEARKARGEQ